MRDMNQTRLQQLPEELLKHILLLLAISDNGAKDIAMVLLVSRRLKQLAMTTSILKDISFGQAPLPSNESFWSRNGLILESARATNQKSYGEIMRRIKQKIDNAHDGLDFTLPLLEECRVKVEAGASASSITEEIRTVNMQVRRSMLRTNLDIKRAESMINKFGRQFFQTPELLVLFDCLKSKLDKYCTVHRLLKEFSDVQH